MNKSREPPIHRLSYHRPSYCIGYGNLSMDHNGTPSRLFVGFHSSNNRNRTSYLCKRITATLSMRVLRVPPRFCTDYHSMYVYDILFTLCTLFVYETPYSYGDGERGWSYHLSYGTPSNYEIASSSSGVRIHNPCSFIFAIFK